MDTRAVEWRAVRRQVAMRKNDPQTHQEKGIDANDGALEARVAGAKATRIFALGSALGKDIVAAVGPNGEGRIRKR